MRIFAGIVTAAIATAGIGFLATPSAADSTISHGPVTINPWEASGFCLTADSITTTVTVVPCADTPTQRWYLNPAGESSVTIESAASHLVLERTGTKPQQSLAAAGNANQKWHLTNNQIAGVTLDGQSQQWTAVPA